MIKKRVTRTLVDSRSPVVQTKHLAASQNHFYKCIEHNQYVQQGLNSLFDTFIHTCVKHRSLWVCLWLDWLGEGMLAAGLSPQGSKVS